MDTPVCHLVLIRSSLALVAWLNFGGVIRFAGTWRLRWSQTIPQAEATLHHCNFMLIERYLSQCSRQQFQISRSLSNSLPLLFSPSLSLCPAPFLFFAPLPRLTLLQLKKSKTHYSVNLVFCVGLRCCVTMSRPCKQIIMDILYSLKGWHRGLLSIFPHLFIFYCFPQHKLIQSSLHQLFSRV